jgi:uncharacterized protein YjdB
MTMVRVNGAPPATSAVAVNKAEIKGQGSIPYAKITTEATPNTATGKMISGEKRAQLCAGAALNLARKV